MTPRNIEVSPRIGIPNKGKWTDELLRFYGEGNPYVSGIPKKFIKDAIDTWVEKIENEIFNCLEFHSLFLG